jgi:hypothetical protein
MQCDKVIKELAAPTDHRDTIALAEHVAGCPSCGSWADRAAQLDRLWDRTRPTEPTSDVWDTVWARMAASLDSSPSTEVESSPRSRPWRPVVIGLVGLAQAAAIFLAVGLAWRQVATPSQTAKLANSISSSPNSELDLRIAYPAEGLPIVVDEGHLVIIHEGRQENKVLLPVFMANLSMVVIEADGQAPKVVDRTPRRMPADEQWWKKAPKIKDQAREVGPLFGVDDWYVMYNEVESMVSPMVAMQE